MLRKFGKGKTIPGENGVAPMRKTNQDAVIFIEDGTISDEGITLVNGAVKNSQNYFDIMEANINKIDETRNAFISAHQNQPALVDQINKYKRFTSNIYTFESFNKEIGDAVYSCINNYLVGPIRMILKNNETFSIEDIFKINIDDFYKMIQDFIIMDSNSIPPMPIESPDYIKLKLLYFKNYITAAVSQELYNSSREFIYNTPMSCFNIATERTNVKITHDNLYYTVQDFIRFTCLQIEASIDIICCKLHYNIINNIEK